MSVVESRLTPQKRSASQLIKELVEDAVPALGAGIAELTNNASNTGKCRPKDVNQYLDRLRTFKTPWWFNRPLAISPIACAQRGWVNVAIDTIQCECCHAQIRVDREGEKWHVSGIMFPLEKSDTKEFEKALMINHSPFCPWRSVASMVNPAKVSDRELALGVDKRLRNLQANLTCCPVISLDRTLQQEIENLACAGWEYAGSDTQATTGTIEYLRCVFCLRTIPVQRFKHCQIKAASAGPEHHGLESPAKVSLDFYTPEGPSRKKTKQTSPSSVWDKNPSSADCKGDELLDPHAFHRFYCPVYSRVDGELGSLSVRIIQARAAATAATAPDFSMDSPPGASVPEAAEAAIAKAEDILRSLDSLLPPE